MLHLAIVRIAHNRLGCGVVAELKSSMIHIVNPCG
jgi:hypothetical protein